MNKNSIIAITIITIIIVVLIIILAVVCNNNVKIKKIYTPNVVQDSLKSNEKYKNDECLLSNKKNKINKTIEKEEFNSSNENYVLPYTLINKLHTTNNLDILDPDYVAIKDLIDLTENHLKSNKHISTINPIGTIIYIQQNTNINTKNYLNYITDLFFTKEEQNAGNVSPVYGFILNTTTGIISGTTEIKNNKLENYHEVYVLCDGALLKGSKVFELYKMLMAKADSASTDTNSLYFNIPNLIEKIIVVNTNKKNIIDDKRIKTDFDNDIIYSIEPVTEPVNISTIYRRYLDTEINPDLVDKFLKYKDYNKKNDNDYNTNNNEKDFFRLTQNKNSWLYKSIRTEVTAPEIDKGSTYFDYENQKYRTLFNEKYKDDKKAKLHYITEMPGELDIDGNYKTYDNIEDIIDTIRNTYNDDAAWINTVYTRQHNNPLFRRYYDNGPTGYDAIKNRLVKNYYTDANLRAPPLFYKSLVGKKNISDAQTIYNNLYNYNEYDGVKYNYILPKPNINGNYYKEAGKYNILTLKDINENKINEIKEDEYKGTKTFNDNYKLTPSLQEYKNRGFINYYRDGNKGSLSTSAYNILKGGPLKSKKELQQILGVDDKDMKSVIDYEELKNNFIVIAETDNNNEPGNLPDNQYMILPFIKVL